ncbi:glutamate-1-semialdehyde 2,1-aminomutase [mine drainage metagenome]|uniref:Glutamate-1-semialdehyde 2,1-aminomutase n=1 Tax=mine drainage metagenome TaxID=410659 RepID=A0A1J5QH30_9ZZZZ
MTEIDRARLAQLTKIETARFRDTHPESARLFAEAKKVMPGGVPMSWMSKWPGEFPLFIKEAKGARFTDVDGHTYIDFCLGDTGAMTGHSPDATVKAVRDQIGHGISLMLPTEDSVIVGTELARRFGLPLWQFTLTATDANRHAIRYARLVTGRSKVLVFDRCYHGSVDETFATLDGQGRTVAREGNLGAPVPLDLTTRVVEFNDLAGVEAALAQGDVACVLTEPALTNVGIVLPEPGFLEGLTALCKKYETLLIIDETHTISAGPGGMTALHSLKPDFLTIGKAIGGGIPSGAFGMTHEVAARIARLVSRDQIDTGGIGGTLAGNALSLAAMRATITEVLTPAAFSHMIPLADAWADGVDASIKEFGLNWHCNRLGARAEYAFIPHAPSTGAQAANAGDFPLEQYLHLRLLNDGFLLTPFHNMALMSPDTTRADVDAHTAAFRAMCAELVGQ